MSIEEDGCAGRCHQEERGAEPQEIGLRQERRLQQNVIPIACNYVVLDLIVAVAGNKPLTHQNTQIVRKIRIRIVYGFILTDETPQFPADRAGTLFLPGVRQNFVRTNCPSRAREAGSERGQGK